MENSQRLKKSARLRTKSDFRFRPFYKRKGKYFLFVYQTKGKGRLGISISKKVLKNAVSRNRVRRLIREAYRKNRAYFPKADVHVIGLESLTQNWSKLSCAEVEREFSWLNEEK